jgi:cytochrome b561
VPFLSSVDLACSGREQPQCSRFWRAIHYWAQYTLYGVLALHVAGALHHYLVHGDDVLQRMLSSK